MPKINTFNSGFSKSATVFGCNEKKYAVIDWWNEEPCRCNPKNCNHFDGTLFSSGKSLIELDNTYNTGVKIKIYGKIHNFKTK